jgi:hypothetical protein
VDAVGELHENDAQVAHHGEQHLAEGFRLRFLAAFESYLVKFGDSVDDLRDVCAKTSGELVFGSRRVFDDIVQNRCDDRVRIKA